MCIIIENKTGQAISETIAERCVTINQDGFGIVYLDGKGGDFRTLDMVIAKRLLVTETRPYVAHCRYTTVGETNTDGIHPFPLGNGRYLFQNGTIETPEASTYSDTYQLAKVLRGLSGKRIAFILGALSQCRWAVVDTRKMRSETFGTWHTDNGVNYSKDNVLKPETKYAGYYSSKWSRDDYSCGSGFDSWGYSVEENRTDSKPTDSGKRWTIAVYGTLKYGHGNHGLIKDSDFLGYGHTSAKMRLCIEGLPYVIRGKHKQGKHVEVEVYSVDAETLAAVDGLEGHPAFYRRDLIDVKLDTVSGSSGKIRAAVYMVGNDYDNGVYHASY